MTEGEVLARKNAQSGPFRFTSGVLREDCAIRGLSYNAAMRPDVRQSIEKEMQAAERARQRQNEGMARVCARRAAGLAAQEFLKHQGVQIRKGSAFDALKLLVNFPGLPPELHDAAAHLTMTVSHEFSLPDDVDLIADAKNLIGGLG